MAVDIKRALTDKQYLDSLDDDQIKELLDKAAGSGELSEEDLAMVSGGVMADTKVVGGGSCATTGGSCLACKRSKITKTC